jgi:hypothetical protein
MYTAKTFNVRVLRTIVAIALLCLIVLTIDRHLFWRSIWDSDLSLLALAVLFFIPNQLLAAYRWSFILSQLGVAMSFRTVLNHSVLGQLSSFVLPGQLSGEIVKVISASHTRGGTVPILLSVLIDKLAILLAIGIVVLVGMLGRGPVTGLASVKYAAFAVVMTAAPILVALCKHRSIWQSGFLGKWLTPRLLRDYSEKMRGEMLSSPSISDTALFKIILAAVCLLSCYGAGSYFVALAMRIEIPPLEWVAINAMVLLVQIVPVSIGGLGIREGAFGAILSLYGVSFSHAIGFSLTGFVLSAVLTLLLWLLLSLIGDR